VNSVLSGVKPKPNIYKRLFLKQARGEHHSQLLLNSHLTITLGSSALNLNLA